MISRMIQFFELFWETKDEKFSFWRIERKKVRWHPIIDIRYSLFKMSNICVRSQQPRMIYKVECHQRKVYDLQMNRPDDRPIWGWGGELREILQGVSGISWCVFGQPLQAVLKLLCRFFRYFVIYSFLSCHFSAYCLCLFWFLLFASFKLSSFHFYSNLSGILCIFPLLSLIR